MDSNLTHYHLVLGEADWRRSSAPRGGALESDSVEWDAERQEVRLRKETIEFLAPPLDLPPDPGDPEAVPPRPSQRRGAAQDRYGNVYFISDAQNSVLVRAAATGRVSTFWPTPAETAATASAGPGVFQPSAPVPQAQSIRLCGLAVTRDHYLAVGSIQPSVVWVFDLQSGGSPRAIDLPAEFEPFELASGADGWTWVLDRQRRRYWVFDPIGKPPREALGGPTGGGISPAVPPKVGFVPVGESAAPSPAVSSAPPRSVSLALEGGDMLAAKSLGNGLLLILRDDRATGTSRLQARQAELPFPVEVGTRGAGGSPSDVVRRGYDLAFVAEPGDPRRGRLLVVGQEGNQAFTYEVELLVDKVRLTPLPDFLPLRRFGGRGLAAGSGQVFYDSEGRWVPVVPQARQRYRTSGRLWTRVFDGREPGCVWHRLFLDACLPEGTALRVRARAGNDWDPKAPEDPLPGAAWSDEPIPRRRERGSELPFSDREVDGDGATFELLFQRAKGRYLQLELTLSGDGRSTPRVRALRCYYPRFSYLEQYLPAVYREDPESASFLDRFLANFEGVNTAIEDRIAQVQRFFDPRCAPADVLEWLASWLGVALDPAWDVSRQRLFLRHAMDFFQWRGTTRGLEMALHLAFDPDPDEAIFREASGNRPAGRRVRILERFRTRSIPVGALPAQVLDEGTQRVASGSWTPADTREDLHRRFRASLGSTRTELRYLLVSPLHDVELWRHFLRRQYGSDLARARESHGGTWAEFGMIPLPSAATANDAVERDWRTYSTWARGTKAAFARDALGFVPPDVTSDLDRWRTFLAERYEGVAQALRDAHGVAGADFDSIPLPAAAPQKEQALKDWRDFVREVGLEGAEELGHWHRFLARRYPTAAGLRVAYGTAYQAAEEVPLPAEPPPDGPPLEDWYHFQAVVLPMHRAAHRFSVLLPAGLEELRDAAGRDRALDLARRLVELEKPAHTSFDVRYYWDFFRVGDARLGEDSHLGGAEREEFVRPLVAGREFLGATYPSRPRLVSRFGRHHIVGESPLSRRGPGHR